MLGTLSACGGGGGGSGTPPPPPAPSFSLNTHTLTFSAPQPTATVPLPQNVTATVTGTVSGQLYVIVTIAGKAVATVSNFSIAGSSGMASVSVVPPSELGGGTFNSTITVQACVGDPTCATGQLSGSPQQISVTYTIAGAPIVNTVSPPVVVAGTAGQVILRGSGFTGTTAVSFGGTAATAFTVDYDIEMHASYPSTLPLGTQAITLTGGGQTFAGSVVVVAPQAYAGTTLQYPQQPARVLATVWDAARQALYVAAAFAQPANDVVWRYVHSGSGWSSPQVIAVADLRDIALPGDGSKLMALTGSAVLEFDANNPTTPTRTVGAAFTGAGAANTPTLLRFAFANDGNALIATGLSGAQGTADSYLYSPGPGTFFDLGASSQLSSTSAGITAGLVSSASGEYVFATQSDPLASPLTLYYDGLTGLIVNTNFFVAQIPDQPLALDNFATRMVLTNGNASYLTDAGQSNLGMLSAGAPILVVIVNPQATRTYVLRTDGLLHSYDLVTLPYASVEIGTGTALSPPSQNSPTLRTAVTPDGATLFLAGDAGVAVVPAPP